MISVRRYLPLSRFAEQMDLISATLVVILIVGIERCGDEACCAVPHVDSREYKWHKLVSGRSRGSMKRVNKQTGGDVVTILNTGSK